MATTVDIEINGTVIKGLAVASGYTPRIGDTVPIDIVNGDALVNGPRDGPATTLVNVGVSDEIDAPPSVSVTTGSLVVASLPFAVQAPAGSAPRPVLVVFGFTGSTIGNAAGFFGVDVDGQLGDIPSKRWHTEFDTGSFTWVWLTVLDMTPGQHTINLNVSNDGGGSAGVSVNFPRIDAFQLG